MKNLSVYKLAMYIISIVAMLFVFTVGKAFAQGPGNNGGTRGYLYNSGRGYQSAARDAQVIGQHIYNQISRDVATRWSNDKAVLKQRQTEAQELPGQATWYVNTVSRYPGWPTR